jgi:hypothetical protein
MRKIGLVLIICVIYCVLPAQGQIPATAYIDGIPEDSYPGAICYLASAGQLMQFADPNITVADVLVRSGMTTQFNWISSQGGYIDPHKRIYDTKNKIYGGQLIDLFRLSGIGYSIGYGAGGGGGMSNMAGADAITLFEDEAEAVYFLKNLIAAGTPVQVHLDFNYVKEDAGVIYRFWRDMPDEPSSHFVLIHGYNEDYVYYTDNSPLSNTEDLNEDGKGDGVGVPLPWDHFLDAWRATEDFTNDKATKTGPYFLLYLTSGPNLVPDDELLGYLYRDGIDGPEILRQGADAIRDGGDASVILREYTRDRKMELVPSIQEVLDEMGLSEVAEKYEQMEAIWQDIRDINTAGATVADALDEITDLVEDSWELLENYANLEEDIYLIEPTDETLLDSLDEVIFRWIPGPYMKKVSLELAMQGDFNDKRSVVKLKTQTGKPHYQMSAKDWQKALSKEDGDGSLLWRIRGLGADAQSISQSYLLEWETLQITASTPADSYTVSETEILEFTFNAPSVAKSICIEISTTGDFSDKKHRIVLKPVKGQSVILFKANTYGQLLKKDDGDSIVYWRVIDKNSQKTTVQPSETRTLLLD